MKTSFIRLLLLPIVLLLNGCTDPEEDPTPASTTPTWSGTLVHDWSSSVRQYDFAAKTDPVIIADGRMPVRLSNGNTIHITGVFQRIQNTNANGSQSSIIYNADETTAVYGPQVSPDGTKLAFSHRKVYTPSKYPVLYGTVITDLSGNYIAGIPEKYNPSWMPDGRLVVAGDFSSDGSGPSQPSGKAGLFIATLTGATATLVNISPALSNPSPLQPAVSPNGSKVAFVLNQHIWLINTDGTNLHQLTAADNDNEESFPAWSPDGKYVACWSYKTFEITYYTAIAIVPADATTPVVLKNDAPVWPRDTDGKRLSGGNGTISWK